MVLYFISFREESRVIQQKIDGGSSEINRLKNYLFNKFFIDRFLETYMFNSCRQVKSSSHLIDIILYRWIYLLKLQIFVPDNVGLDMQLGSNIM